jgi:D-alanine-D-alanine ligase
LKVLILCHPDLIPPAKNLTTKQIEDEYWRSEAYVARALRRLGHQVEFFGIDKDWYSFLLAQKTLRPDLVFNLLEEFSGETLL